MRCLLGEKVKSLNGLNQKKAQNMPFRDNYEDQFKMLYGEIQSRNERHSFGV